MWHTFMIMINKASTFTRVTSVFITICNFFQIILKIVTRGPYNYYHDIVPLTTASFMKNNTIVITQSQSGLLNHMTRQSHTWIRVDLSSLHYTLCTCRQLPESGCVVE